MQFIFKVVKNNSLWPVLFNFYLEHPTRKAEASQEGLELNVTHQHQHYIHHKFNGRLNSMNAYYH